MSAFASKKPLQVTVAALGLVPVTAGAAGILYGPSFVMDGASGPVDLDSHFRYLSGIFLGVGFLFYATIPSIERKTALFRLGASLVVCGGFARLGSLAMAGSPSAFHLAGLCLELIAVPALVVWQGRVAANAPQAQPA